MADYFDLQTKRLVWIPVTWTGLSSEGDQLGEPVEYTIELQVELVDLDEFGRLFVSPYEDVVVTPATEFADAVTEQRVRANAIPPATPERLDEWATINDTVRALAITRDWRKVKSGGVAVPYSAEAMSAMMRVPNFGPALFLQAYPTAYAGMKDTRLGNSASSPAVGAASAVVEQ